MADQMSTDKSAIIEVINLYEHVCDGAELNRLDEVYTQDVIVDGSAVGLPVCRGLDEAIAVFALPLPSTVLVHLGCNPLVEVEGDEARCVSKTVGVFANGTIGVAIHSDRLRRTPHGWRVRERTITPPPHRVVTKRAP